MFAFLYSVQGDIAILVSSIRYKAFRLHKCMEMIIQQMCDLLVSLTSAETGDPLCGWLDAGIVALLPLALLRVLLSPVSTYLICCNDYLQATHPFPGHVREGTQLSHAVWGHVGCVSRSTHRHWPCGEGSRLQNLLLRLWLYFTGLEVTAHCDVCLLHVHPNILVMVTINNTISLLLILRRVTQKGEGLSSGRASSQLD